MGGRGAENEEDGMLFRMIFVPLIINFAFAQKIEDAPSTRWGRTKARLMGMVDVRI